MMNNGTYVKLYRKMTEWEWYSDTNCVRVFLHLLLRANWEDSEYRGMPVPRGSVVVGRKALSEQLGISERCIRTTINRLVKCQAIDQQTTNQFSIISVCKFDTYNPLKDVVDQQTTSKRPASDQQPSPKVTTSKEDNKIIREEDKNSFEKAWIDYGRKGNKAAALRYWSKLSDSDRAEIQERIPLYHADNPEVQYRKDFSGWINPANKMWQNKLKSELKKSTFKPISEFKPIGEIEAY